jgi:superoxide dismutase, Fe-Mn family
VPTYALPDLRYDYGALAPAISAEQMELHHSKHHAVYVNKANELIDQLHDLPIGSRAAVSKAFAFNLSGHVLHSLFWTSLTPSGSPPDGAMLEAIGLAFGSLDALTKQLGEAISTLMGSGWAALVWEPVAGRLVVTQLRDHQDNGLVGATPLLVVDGWEHAYYVDHRNNRDQWVSAVTPVLDWASASKRFAAISDGAAGGHP